MKGERPLYHPVVPIFSQSAVIVSCQTLSLVILSIVKPDVHKL